MVNKSLVGFQKCESKFGKFEQLILIEQVKQCVHPDIKTHLDERDISDLHKDATVADDYSQIEF